MCADATRSAIEKLVHSRLEREIDAIDTVEPGLGTRRFYRIRLVPSSGHPTSLIARVEAPEDPALRPEGVPPEPPLEPLRHFLESNDLPVPKSFASAPESGIDLLEDLGPESLEMAATNAAPETRRALYHEACALVPQLQRLQPEGDARNLPAFRRRLDAALIRYKAEQFIEWCLPWGLGRGASSAEVEVVREAFALVAREVEAAPARFAHRDFKAANLHLRPGAPAGRRLVLIDLQGALLAPPEYDLVCLLRDAHVALPDDEVESHSSAVRGTLPDAPDPECFERRFTLLTLTRNGKDLARYLYAARERGDERYLHLLPNSLRILCGAARRAADWDPRLARLSELIENFQHAAETPCEP